MYRRIFALIIAVLLLVVAVPSRATATYPAKHTYGFLVDGGHLYLPYVYFHWTDTGDRLSGTVESLETSMSEDGYVAHRYHFTGHAKGNRLFMHITSRRSQWSTDPELRFEKGRFYLKEGQTGAVWWQPGKPMNPGQWALTALKFMECYTNPYDYGHPGRKCTNMG